MIYVISEDEGSGLSFWKIFFETYFDEYQIITDGKSAGNHTLKAQLDSALSMAKDNDIVFVAFDKIYSSDGFDTGDFINLAKEKCSRKSVDLVVTNYYCFEEIYLSYPEIEEMLRKDGRDDALVEVAAYIYEKINSDEDYFRGDRWVREQIESRRADAAHNREHFADAALYIMTKSIKNGYFTINKSRLNGINKCWTLACDDIRNSKKNDISHMCSHCAFSQKGNGRKEKLDDLCKRSCLVADIKDETIEWFGVKI